MYVINGNGLSRRDEFRDACARKARPGQARRMMDEEQWRVKGGSTHCNDWVLSVWRSREGRVKSEDNRTGQERARGRQRLLVCASPLLRFSLSFSAHFTSRHPSPCLSSNSTMGNKHTVCLLTRDQIIDYVESTHCKSSMNGCIMDIVLHLACFAAPVFALLCCRVVIVDCVV